MNPKSLKNLEKGIPHRYKKGFISPWRGKNRPGVGGNPTANLGRKFSKEWRMKIGESNRGKKNPNAKPPHYKGERHWNWKGGLAKFTYTQRLEIKAGRKKPELCELCGNGGKICFDHDHRTGKFRGWICDGCNTTLGRIKDNIHTLELMIEYLKKNG